MAKEKRKSAFLILRVDVEFKKKLTETAKRLNFKTISEFIRHVLDKSL